MSSERELEEQLKEAGKKLLEEPPSSIDELLPLLDQIENFLSRVEQSPAKSMQAALSPLTKALVADELLRHSNVDVRVAVASCISEITRITAPDAPYDDDKMKDVFQLIVSSFENLSDKESRSYNKRAVILETVAKVRSCVVMLDLECDGLIAEMFQLFLGTIRDYHPSSIFSSMETIMTLVLEESEDVSPEVLTPLLATMKKDNKEVMTIAVKLAEKVFENCAVKLKPYLNPAIKSLDASLADYSSVVTSICEGSPYATRPTEGNNPTEQLDLEDKSARESVDEDHATEAEESKLAASFVDKTAHVARDKETCAEDVDAVMDISSKAASSNGVDDTGTRKQGACEKEESGADIGDQPATDKVASNTEVDDSEAVISASLESKLDHPDRKRGNKSNASSSISESSDTSHVVGEKEVEDLPDVQGSPGKSVHGSPTQDTNSTSGKPSIKDTSAELSTPSEPVHVASPSLSGTLHDERRSKKAGRAKKKETTVQEETPLVDFLSKKVAEGTNDSEVKAKRRTGKRTSADVADEDKVSNDVDTSKINSGGASDSEIKMEEIDRKVNESSNVEDAPSLKMKKDGKKRGRGKAALENEVPKSSAKDDQKEVFSSMSPTKKAEDEESHEETNWTNTKRKRTMGKDKAPENVEYGENLVGAKVQVWWPTDKEYYKGTVDSFDPIKKKHKVLYNDGDEEILNLKREKWEFIEDSLSSEERAAEPASPDSASGMQKKKKAKTVSESSSAKYGRTEASPKSGAASSSRSKGTVSKSGRKTKNDEKVDRKSKDKTSKPVGKTEDDISGGKPKLHSQNTGGRRVNDSSKTSMKSKDVDGKIKTKQESPKIAASKSKQESPKSGTKSKGKAASQDAAGTNSNGLDKVKHGSSKTRESEKLIEKSLDSGKTPEGVKGRSSESKAQDKEAVSTKKRRRG